MEAELFLDILCGLGCVIICLLTWILFRSEKQNHEFRMRLGVIENEHREIIDATDAAKLEKEAIGNDSAEKVSGMLNKMEESIQKSILDISERMRKLEVQFEIAATKCEWFEEALESIRSDTQNLEEKMTTVPLHRYYDTGTRNHFYTTNWDELGSGRMNFVYEGVAGHIFPSPRHPAN